MIVLGYELISLQLRLLIHRSSVVHTVRTSYNFMLNPFVVMIPHDLSLQKDRFCESSYSLFD